MWEAVGSCEIWEVLFLYVITILFMFLMSADLEQHCFEKIFCSASRFLQVFLEGERASTYLTTEHRKELLQGAASEITRRYYELASDLVSVVCQFICGLLCVLDHLPIILKALVSVVCVHTNTTITCGSDNASWWALSIASWSIFNSKSLWFWVAFS